MYQVVKRDGKIVDFNINKIADAIKKAFDAVAPASTAALTAPTSPRTITVTSPEPICCLPIR